MIQFRSGAQGYGYDLSNDLKRILLANGMKANIAKDPSGNDYLVVKSSDMVGDKVYKLNNKQLNELTAIGNGRLTERAYNQLIDIIRKDFNIPPSYTHAQAAGERGIVTGLYGYRNPGGGRYRDCGGNPYRNPFVTSMYSGENPNFIRERKDGRMFPGELKSGDYGFKYKGTQENDITFKEKPVRELIPAARPIGMAKPLSETVNMSSAMYFDKDAWLEVLNSHGIVIDPSKRTMTIQSAQTRRDLTFDLTTDEYNKVTSPRLVTSGKETGVSLNERLSLINEILSNSFVDKVTQDQLESKNLINIELKPEVKALVEKDFIEQDKQTDISKIENSWSKKIEEARQNELDRLGDEDLRIELDEHAVNGRDIDEILEGKGFFSAAKHGREIVVGEIRVDKKEDGTYAMKAMINGEIMEHSITSKQYNRFLDHDDEARLKDFEKVFSKEVAIRKAAPRNEDDDVIIVEGGTIKTVEAAKIAHSKNLTVDGRDLRNIDDHKGFYVDINHGREVDVQKIEVEKIKEGAYRMTAVIGGRAEKLETRISEKDYNKFLAMDDYHRMKLFARLFPEADIKTRPEYKTSVGQTLLNALVVAKDILEASSVALGRPLPEIYEDTEQHDKILFSKPGLISPEMSAANYENISRPSIDEEQARGVSMGV